jgi:DNA-binding transcriptional regulator YhcF (GntR family)
MTATVTPTVFRTLDTETETMTTRDMAAELGVTPKALRRALRNAGVGCGQGSFYVINRADLPALRTRLGINA